MPMQTRAPGETTPEVTSSSNQFGTFGGVFTPSILTILGVVMFMRTGYVTGVAGIGAAIAVLLISKMITLLTGLSISAISTNTRVQGGGAYFLISRSLGPEFGASIGLALFLAQALSVPFYILGFVEALTTTSPHLAGEFTMIGLIITTFLFALNYVGSGWAIRAQYLILGVLVASIIAFMGGGILAFDPEIARANWAPAFEQNSESFWTIFAVFFPAVTGIMAGVNMSGDLKEPAHSIPRGTLAAIGVGAFVYLAQTVIMAGALPRQALIDRPYETLLDAALFDAGWLVIAGVYAATLSSAIGSMMGAPRILQALARDRIFSPLEPFAQGTEHGDEPRNGLWLTFAMTAAVLVFAGNGSGGGALNAVANVLTMFFLFTYGMTNVAAAIEILSRNPSFRPRFRYFHWSTALLGGIGCFGAAFLINPVAAAAAAAVIVIIFLYVSRRVLETTFGDARRGFVYERVRQNLLRLDALTSDAKNWRPTTLVLSGNPNSRATLTRYAGWLAGGSGLVTLARVVEGDLHGDGIALRDELTRDLRDYIASEKLSAFPEVHVSPNFEEGFAGLLQSHSIGPIKPNLLLLGWPNAPERAAWFAQHLRLSERLGLSQVVLFDRGLPPKPDRGNPPQSRRIDVWWRGLHNGSLMIILAHLLTGNWSWSGATIRLLHLARSDEDLDALQTRLEHIIKNGRFHAEIVIIDDDAPFKQVLTTHSADAEVVFLGFTPPDDDSLASDFHSLYSDLASDLPTTLLISSTGDADLES